MKCRQFSTKCTSKQHGCMSCVRCRTGLLCWLGRAVPCCAVACAACCWNSVPCVLSCAALCCFVLLCCVLCAICCTLLCVSSVCSGVCHAVLLRSAPVVAMYCAALPYCKCMSVCVLCSAVLWCVQVCCVLTDCALLCAVMEENDWDVSPTKKINIAG